MEISDRNFYRNILWQITQNGFRARKMQGNEEGEGVGGWGEDHGKKTSRAWLKRLYLRSSLTYFMTSMGLTRFPSSSHSSMAFATLPCGAPPSADSRRYSGFASPGPGSPADPPVAGADDSATVHSLRTSATAQVGIRKEGLPAISDLDKVAVADEERARWGAGDLRLGK